jgi:hypothetical protein
VRRRNNIGTIAVFATEKQLMRLSSLCFAVLTLSMGCAPAVPSAPATPPPRPAAAIQPAGRVVVQNNEQPPARNVPVAPQIVYRPDDSRTPHDDEQLAALGIQRYESTRLKLYTDIAADEAKPLPALVDAAYDALSAYFGWLPPARDGSEFQMTGYLLRDERRFREAGLIPEDLPTFEHGRHRRNEFWMRDQQFDYYRRHLLIHEVTHCVMTYMPDVRAPVWYFEGMAELFGTHRLQPDGTFEWGLMPDTPENFAGMGRITLVRQSTSQGRARSMAQVMAQRPEEFLEPLPYAWSWALCHFLAHHPRYRDRFRELGQHTQGTQFAPAVAERFQDDASDLETEWALFTTNLQYGYDLERSVISFVAGTPLTENEPQREVEVRADRGWQSSQVLLEAGQEYELAAKGQFTLANEPKPWVSEPQGVSIHYFDGNPLGQLLACVRNEERAAGASETMLNVLPIGRGTKFVLPVAGTLYLRLNDSWSELGDNTGTIQVTIRPVAAKAPGD